jgi:hypothetical protein
MVSYLEIAEWTGLHETHVRVEYVNGEDYEKHTTNGNPTLYPTSGWFTGSYKYALRSLAMDSDWITAKVFILACEHLS